MTSQTRARWGWLESYVLILFLLNGLLLLPGSQPLRFIIRAAPYVASLLSLLVIRRRWRAPSPPGGFALRLVPVLLVLNLLHPHTQLRAGIAQVLFQIAIIAPAFWAVQLIPDDGRLLRLLRIFWACNAVGAMIGLLQIYFPDQFLPAEWSGEASASWLHSMTFLSPTGRLLVRPPGLSDLPGGAAMAGSLAAILGFGFSALRSNSFFLRLIAFGSALAGVAVLYLTQVRSLTLMTVAAIVVLLLFGSTQGAIWSRGWMTGAAAVLIVGSFTWAVAIGGEKVRERFLNLGDQGVMQSYEWSRGRFWRYTFGEGIAEYPLGAGLGRWGMMGVYFADANRPDSPTLWAEIQPTGWLYDGGVPMWMLYGSALGTSILFLFRVARSSRYETAVPFAATLAFCVNGDIIGASFSGPAFNTSMGIQYWLLLAVVYGAARKSWRGPEEREVGLCGREVVLA